MPPAAARRTAAAAHWPVHVGGVSPCTGVGPGCGMHGVHPRAWEWVAHAARREAVRGLHATGRDAQETVFMQGGVKHEKRREGRVTCVTPGGVSPCRARLHYGVKGVGHWRRRRRRRRRRRWWARRAPPTVSRRSAWPANVCVGSVCHLTMERPLCVVVCQGQCAAARAGVLMARRRGCARGRRRRNLAVAQVQLLDP